MYVTLHVARVRLRHLRLLRVKQFCSHKNISRTLLHMVIVDRGESRSLWWGGWGSWAAIWRGGAEDPPCCGGLESLPQINIEISRSNLWIWGILTANKSLALYSM